MVRTSDEALLASMEEEADREGQREIMLQITADSAERQRLEHLFAKERTQAARMLLQLTSDHELAVKTRCRELNVASVDTKRVLLSKSDPTLIHRAGKRDLSTPANAPLHSRNCPEHFQTYDQEVLMVWAARSALRAMKHAHVLPPDLLTKTRSSPFGPEGHHAKLVQKRKRRNGVYPSSSTPLPGRLSPYMRDKEDPVVMVPFYRFDSEKAQLMVFDHNSGTNTPTYTPLASRENSRTSSKSTSLESRSKQSLLTSREQSRVSLKSGSSPSIEEVLEDLLSQNLSGPVVQKDNSHFTTGRTPSPVSRQLSKSSDRLEGIKSVYHELCPESASHRRQSSWLMRSVPPVRRVTTSSLRSELGDSLSELSFTGSCTSLTSERHKSMHWDEVARELVGMNEPMALDKHKGELLTQVHVSSAMSKAYMTATRQHLIRQSVDLPSGIATGVIGRDRPATVYAMREAREECRRLLSADPSSNIQSDRFNVSRKCSNLHLAIQRNHHQAISAGNSAHYENVRLRTVISNHMDKLMYAEADKDEKEANEKMLGKSIAQLAAKDATSSLSLFPRILEVLFGVLEATESDTSRLAIAEGLSCIATQTPVQTALISGIYKRQDQEPEAEARRFLDVLAQLITSSTDSKLTAQYASVILHLCRSELGFQKCSRTGLLDALEGLSTASGDPKLCKLFEAIVSTQRYTMRQDSAMASDNYSSTGNVGEISRENSRSSLTSSKGMGWRAMATKGEERIGNCERTSWKPASEKALPIWERLPNCLGVNNKTWQTQPKANIGYKIEIGPRP